MARSDAYDQESSGGLAGFEFTVEDAYFAPDPAYTEKAGVEVLFLHWVGTSDADGHEMMSADGFHPKFSVGPDWQTLDGGKTIQHPRGNAKVGKSYGRMLKIAAEATKELEGTPEDFLEHGDFRDARIWIGTRWYMDEVERDFGGQIGKRSELMPVKFLGFANKPSGGSGGSAQTSGQQDSQAAASGGLREQIENLARALDDFDEFKRAALSLPGVTADADLMMAVMESGPDGLYAKARS